MPMRMDEFLRWAAFRKSSTTAEEETVIFVAVVPLNWFPVVDSRSKNQKREDDAEEDCWCGLNVIFTFLREKNDFGSQTIMPKKIKVYKIAFLKGV